MDIFLRQVPPELGEPEIKIAFSKILHRPPFQRSDAPLINFDIRLFPHRHRHGQHRGMGNLTLPTVEVGELLLGLYSQITIGAHTIDLSRSNRSVSEGVLKRITATRWKDPIDLQMERKRKVEGSTPIPLLRCSFGRLCRDGVFSAEVDFRDQGLTVAMDMENRQLRLTFPEPSASISTEDPLSLIFGLLGRRVEEVVFGASQIVALVASEKERSIYLESNTQPIFQAQRSHNIFSEDSPPDRSSCLAGRSTMAYFSRGVYLSFPRAEQFNQFRQRRGMLNLPRLIDLDIPIVARGIYSETRLEQAHDALGRMEFEVAFESERAMVIGLLEPSEIVALHSLLPQFSPKYGSTFSAIFRTFIAGLGVPGFGRGRRRPQNVSRMPSEPVASTLLVQLEAAALKYQRQLSRPRQRLRLSPASIRAFHLTITPSTRIMEGPLPDRSNSILHRFGHHDSFLRVSFEDEGRGPLSSRLEMSIDALLNTRVYNVLTGGLRLAGRRYEFLGWSMSGLRLHSTYFVRPFNSEDGNRIGANEIRMQLGNFEHLLYKPARLGARWAQAFSDSDPTVELAEGEMKEIPDKISEGGSLFTDGSGTMSTAVRDEISSILGQTRDVSAVQIRLGGLKGIFVEDPTLQGRVVCYRRSQKKFEAPLARMLHVTSTSFKPMPMYLNQPLILLLEHLGVDGQYLFLLQQNAIAEVSTVRTCLPDASRAFSQHGLGASFRLPSLFQNLRSQLNLDLKVTGRPVIRHQLVDSCLWFGVTHILREIKYRARIPVPGSYTLIGVPDEWDCLNEGEIFATIFDPRTGDLLPIEGRVVVTRSPQLHPGDLQLVQAVRRTQLEHLRNVVVFPSKGFRSMPSMLAGGDLDGDIFNLILDPKLHSHYNATPASYEGLPDKVVPSPCTVDDVARFFVDYVKSDLLGYISILHRRCADVGSPSDDICVQLAEHASHAVDYPKTGAAVNFRDLPRPPSREKPDFLAAEGVDPTNHPAYYPSPKILGRLFRNVPMEADSMDEEEYLEPTAASVIRTALRGIDTTALDLPPLSQPSDDDLSPMRDLFEAYIDQLRTIAHAHSLSTYYRLSEGELVSGMIHARWTDRRRRQRSVAMMNIETQELAKAVRRELYGDDGGDVNEVVAQHDDDRVRRRGSFTRAYAAWLVSEEILESDPGAFGPQSFGLIALGVLLEMVKQSRQMVYGSAW